MPLTTPSDLELNTLRDLVDFSGLRVLEIGAGDGRLAWPLADGAECWIALDPDADEVRLAAEDKQERERGKEKAGEGEREVVRLSIGDGRQLAFPDGYFDIAFFTWSLC